MVNKVLRRFRGGVGTTLRNPALPLILQVGSVAPPDNTESRTLHRLPEPIRTLTSLGSKALGHRGWLEGTRAVIGPRPAFKLESIAATWTPASRARPLPGPGQQHLPGARTRPLPRSMWGPAGPRGPSSLCSEHQLSEGSTKFRSSRASTFAGKKQPPTLQPQVELVREPPGWVPLT